MSIRENDNLLFRIYQGEPIKLRWGAWVTDTYLLQRDGWKFHAEEHFDEEHRAYQIRLAVTSPDNYVILSGTMYVRGEDLMHYRGYYPAAWHNQPVHLQQFTAKEVFRVINAQEFNSWNRLQEIDITAPTFAKDYQIRMRDFKFFQAMDGTNPRHEIFIPEKSVDELFNEILKIQYPQQQEIKKGLIMPAAKPLMQAKIFSLAA